MIVDPDNHPWGFVEPPWLPKLIPLLPSVEDGIPVPGEQKFEQLKPMTQKEFEDLIACFKAFGDDL